MTEVEKLYKNAGINATAKTKEIRHNVFECGLFYPDFTAEKQIAILQLLTQRCDLTISHFSEWEFIHYDGQEPLEITGKDFTETFVKLINVYWQFLTEEEKQQIRSILK